MSGSECLLIRKREPSDVPVLIELLTSVYNLTKYPVDGPPSFPARFQSSKALTSIVALYDGSLAGHVELQDLSGLNSVVIESLQFHGPISSFAALVSLFVDPRVQGKGIGVRLVEEAVASARVQGKRLVLIVLDKDTGAIHMYERMGRKRGVESVYESVQGVKYRAFSYLAPA
jgi:ribosomal protein S18 acetylase RimI-like enzyme